MNIILTQSMIAFVLIFIRFTSLIMIMPIFSNGNIPSSIKILFSYFMSLIFFRMGNYELAVNYKDFSQFFISALLEFVNGVSIGFIIILVTNAIFLVGQIIDTNIGFSIVNVISPTIEEQMPVTANIYYMIMVNIFMMINAHHKIIEAINIWLIKVPLGTFIVTNDYLKFYNNIIVETFDIGIRMAMPIILTILLSDLLLGILSKAMPGLNVFIIGLPFKAFVGLISLLLIFPSTEVQIREIIKKIIDYIYILILGSR